MIVPELPVIERLTIFREAYIAALSRLERDDFMRFLIEPEGNVSDACMVAQNTAQAAVRALEEMFK